jgi:CheY-like chemotaxis protein
MGAFEERLQGLVADFLETALVVDDEATRSAAAPSAPATDEEPPPTPRARVDLALNDPPEGTVEGVEDHPLNAKALTDAFAERGIICSVIAPQHGEEIQERVLQAAGRADLLVFDWELNRDGGTTARQLIRGVLDQDAQENRRRLRVIAIYTGQPDLPGIMRRLATHLALEGAAQHDGGLTLEKDGFRIVGLCKPLEERLNPALAARQLPEADLPARLTSEFAKLTDGLVPAVALAALAAIRNDAHRILQAVDNRLDLAYLGHRVASPFPTDTESHLVSMLAAEIASILDDRDVGAHADLSAINDWLARAREQPTDPLRSGSALAKPHDFTYSQIETMLTDGLGLDDRFKEQRPEGVGVKTLEAVRREAVNLFTNNADEAQSSSDAFAHRMAVRTLYARPRRRLGLGTIVFGEQTFLLCMQPLCDSVRLDVDEPRGFPFLPLTEITGPGYFVVRDPHGDGLLRLSLRPKPLHLRVITFKAGPARCIEATCRKGQWAFHNHQNRRFQWVAELKPEFAQRAAVELGGQLARVGLDESELVRLSLP